jgi:hypothetical protein
MSLADFASQPTVSPVYVQNGNSPWAQRYSQELQSVVLRYADRLPRNVQRHLGPSELGHKCSRMLVGKMAGFSLHGSAGAIGNAYVWSSVVGTALHSFMEEAFTWDSVEGLNPGRWFTERRVTPDPGAEQPHPGTADMYDGLYRAVVDWKGLALDTRIPTPDGWTTTGQLAVGDKVFGSDGRPCTVTKVYPVQQQRECYVVKFKTGSPIVTDDVQLWEISRNRNGGSNPCEQETVLLSTRELREQLRAKGGNRQLRVRTTAALELPEAELPVDPYVLGVWLGDGDRHGGQICQGKQDADEVFGYIRARGYSLGKDLAKREDGLRKHTVLGLLKQLQAAGCVILVKDSSRVKGQGYLGEKLIPERYLRASRSQRLELLRGIMDADGDQHKTRNQSRLTTVNKKFAYQVEELAASLGWKPYTVPVKKQGFGKVYEDPAYQVLFTSSDDNPFHLKRKAELVRPLRAGVRQLGYRMVQEVELVSSVPTRCIDVDSADRLFLATEQFIPVHNCQSEAVRTRLRRDGPPVHYSVQMLLYAVGYMLLGFEVERVVLVSWPRTKSTLEDMYVWEHTITNDDLRLVQDVLDKTEIREQIAKLVTAGEMSFWDVPPTPGADCTWCPFHNPAALQDRSPNGCPGMSLLKLQRNSLVRCLAVACITHRLRRLRT